MSSDPKTGKKHPYLNPENWLKPEFQFWNDGLHNEEKYQPFVEEMKKRASKKGKIDLIK
jgi:hypothetical protein